jgi:phenylpropionate dioxygenase-like ring-hydroxylating dioxygenase large terminal subunit
MASFTEKFARNQWYVAAYGREVGRELLARTICGEPIVFYRSEDGQPVALSDRCVHRRFPLSKSNLDGNRIVCGYHGFTYDTGGTCVAVPGQKRIPCTARVPSYPVVEQDSFVWVWIGDADRAGETTIPRAPWLNQEGWTAIDGMEYLPARYDLLVDNLFDLSHETYLHAGYIGTPEVAETPITTEVDDDASVVHVSRRRRGMPALLRRVHQRQGPYRPLAGHRVPPAVPLPPAQQGRAGRGRARRGRRRFRRLPRRGGLRDHARDGDLDLRLLGGRA